MKKRIVSKIETAVRAIRSAPLHKLVSQQQKSPVTSRIFPFMHLFSTHPIDGLPSITAPPPRRTT